MEAIDPYILITAASIILIISYFFGEISKKTNIPSVLLLIVLGVLIRIGLEQMGYTDLNFFPALQVLGIVGLIMIVLEAALELKLDKNKYGAISRAFFIALVGVVGSAWLTAIALQYYIPSMSSWKAWLYATPLSIISSAIVIPSVVNLREDKKEFHIYESTFSDILGIIMFYFIIAQLDSEGHGGGVANYFLTTLLTIVLAVVFSYLIVIIFQNIQSNVKLFLLIAVLILLYSLGKMMHLSSLIIILVFGLVIANMQLFFRGYMGQFLDYDRAKEIYEGLHVITAETAFVVRTFFFVIFGMTIDFDALASWDVAAISLVCIFIIYIIRFLVLRVGIGKDIFPQVYTAPRGLITILLFYNIPPQHIVEEFSTGILLYVIIGTSLIMTFAMIADKNRTEKIVKQIKDNAVKTIKWKAPGLEEP